MWDGFETGHACRRPGSKKEARSRKIILEIRTNISRFSYDLFLAGGEARGVRQSDGLNPRIAPDEPSWRKVKCMCARDVLDSSPFYTIFQACAGASVVEFGVEACPEGEIAHPRQPTLRLDQVVNVGFHDDGPRELLPWPPEIRSTIESHRVECGIGDDGAILEDQCCWLAPLFPTLCCHNALLVFQWLADNEGTVLEDCSSIAEDEVDCARDGAVAVELAFGVRVKRVLVSIHGAVVEDGHIGLDS